MRDLRERTPELAVDCVPELAGGTSEPRRELRTEPAEGTADDPELEQGSR
jgi:hypothetical protein